MMNLRWSYFAAAAFFAAYFLINRGAPPVAVAAGLAGAGFFMWRRNRAKAL
jgi:hypothetical protein